MSACRALARLAFRSSSRAAAAPVRSLATTSRISSPATTVADVGSSTGAAFSPSEAHVLGQSTSVSPPSAIKRRSAETNKIQRTLTRVGKARQLAQWSWLTEEQLTEVAQALESADPEASLPQWLNTEHDAAKTFRSARSRLWLPSEVPEDAQAGAGESVVSWVDGEVARRSEQYETAGETSDEALAWDALSLEEQRDEVLKSVWKKMSPEDRRNAFIECRFTCLRKLGWRSGYSAGYPAPAGSEEASRRAQLVASTSGTGAAAAQAFEELRERDEDLAWQAWTEMDPAKREQEELDAWASRDRSTLFIDDSPTSTVLGGPMPRWYATPQRAGQLVFLPNFIVRLVRNTTPKGQSYDPWKATFRVPLNLHKHAVKSYLLSVYGLRTTWIRSMIYRSSLERSSGRRVVTGKGRTFKKVEVGLLEPFVFPAISDAFKKRHLYETEMKFEMQKAYLKFTTGRRWRGGRTVDLTTSSSSSSSSAGAAKGSNETEELVGVDPEDDGSKKERPTLMVRRNRIPTKKHGSILRMLAQKRQSRADEVDAKAEEIRRSREQAETAQA